LYTWLHGILRNLCHRHRRKQKRLVLDEERVLKEPFQPSSVLRRCSCCCRRFRNRHVALQPEPSPESDFLYTRPGTFLDRYSPADLWHRSNDQFFFRSRLETADEHGLAGRPLRRVGLHQCPAKSGIRPILPGPGDLVKWRIFARNLR
jgi:hypothetical protein